jgi:hypothetical protein
MVPALGNQDGIIMHCIDQTVLQVYPAGPETGQLVLERFRFADPYKRITLNLFDKQIDPLQDGSVCYLPVQVILPPV